MEVAIPISSALDLADFRKMDYYAVEKYQLPIELMMENAGLHLATLAAGTIDKTGKIVIGVGNGNNGGGGLVAARRLAAWGFEVRLDLYGDIEKELPRKQLDRALAFGATTSICSKPDLWIDTYLGFSQRLPLRPDLLKKIDKANATNCLRISLGYSNRVFGRYFHKLFPGS